MFGNKKIFIQYQKDKRTWAESRIPDKSHRSTPHSAAQIAREVEAKRVPGLLVIAVQNAYFLFAFHPHRGVFHHRLHALILNEFSITGSGAVGAGSGAVGAGRHS